ncbi:MULTISPECIES: DUF2835 domain-containing protein [unclassified Photobacterium]|uniref:DUF2835 domain-containing protein n=1 Tax=unclassified Photobacterium TaxID=2628852 RepID=UPI00006B34D2|nr:MULTISPECIES: DUF2835 domain-containing protein [unclassified Photobacterium]EAR53647.1 hypothetical protein SKA34_13860 [Photobacterium sp. SKA34]PSV31280.1 DUF2835 domain-containing protein [Photobacterium sp. GB-72]PSV34877.1 DUF2835 domain-containing protein [Photobacterium sp. GB-210]PSV37174.1 DUF2835 domain-containing protein [Photobacterium sp. GB-27]PSV44630.1 DUF2835 domain-containing protein [Photobacterium sp. GB-36]
MRSFTFRVNISYQVFLQHYSGAASSAVVVTENGLKLQLPAVRLRPYLTQMGVRGRFQVAVDDNNKLTTLTKLSD